VIVRWFKKESESEYAKKTDGTDGKVEDLKVEEGQYGGSDDGSQRVPCKSC
jgi:hypothetical protein